MTTPQARGFGEVLRRHRMAAGLTQEALAERASLSTRTISALEQGVNHRPRHDTVAFLAAALDLAPQQRAAFDAAARRPPALSPGPPGPNVGLSASLVGRASEIALLTRHLSGEGPPVLLLSGEPGIGKSRLLRAAMQQGQATGWTVLSGGCQRHGGHDLYAPLLRALEQHIHGQSDTQLRVTLAGCAWLVRLLPEIITRPVEPLPSWHVSLEQERRLIFAAVSRYLTNVAGPQGTVLVLDDLQWAGADALALLGEVIQSASVAPVRVIAAYRNTDLHPRAALSLFLADLAGAGLARQRELRPLIPPEARRLLSDLLYGSPGMSDALQERLVQRTGGVPFFLVSCTQGWWRGGEDGPEESIPWDVARSVRQRVAALPEGTQEVLRAAAVMGRSVSRALLIGVVGRPERAVLADLQVACESRLLEEEGPASYRFAHDLIHEVVEADLGAAWRMFMHRTIAQVLEATPGEPSVASIAEHYAQTDEHATAARWLERAGDQAAARFAHTLALTHYDRAYEHLMVDGRDQRSPARLDEKCGDLCLHRGDLSRAQEYFARARTALRDPLRRAELWRKEGETWGGMAAFARALAAFDAAEREAHRAAYAVTAPRTNGTQEREAVAGDQDVLLPGLVRATIAVSRAELFASHQQDQDSAQAAAESAVALLSDSASSARSALVLAHAQHYLGDVAVLRGDAARGEEYLRRSLSVRRRLGQQQDIGWTWASLGNASYVRGDLAEAEERYRHALTIMERIGHQAGIAICGGECVGLALLDQGRLSEAEACFRRGLAIVERMGALHLTAWHLCHLGQVTLEQGYLPAALRWYREGRRQAREREDAVLERACLLGVARVRMRQGRLRAAGFLLAYARTLAPTQGFAWEAAQAACYAAELHLSATEIPEAQAEAQRGLRLATDKGWRREEAVARRLLGQCARMRGETASAEDQLRSALALFLRCGAALEAARTSVLLAEILAAGAAERGIPHEAGPLLARAQTQFAASGATRDLAQAGRVAATWATR